MEIRICLPQGRAVTLPLTYDLKCALLNVNEDVGKKGEREEAIQALTQNLQLFGRGSPLYMEGFQKVATWSRLRELGVPTQALEGKRGFLAKVRTRLGRKPEPSVELDGKRWSRLGERLVETQKIALGNLQVDRVNEISSLLQTMAGIGS